jgi:signal transduction histidine kinase
MQFSNRPVQDGAGSRKGLPGRLLVDFCGLSMRILRLANRGVSKPEFVREVFSMLKVFSGCDQITLELSTEGDRFRWDALPEHNGGMDVRYEKNGPDAKSVRNRSESEYGSVLSVPFSVDDKTSGLLLLMSIKKDYFRKHEVEFYQGLGQTLGVAIADRRAQSALRERVKELTCLYDLSQTVHKPSVSVDDILRHAVSIIPPAFQFPESTTARITLDSCTFASPGFTEGPFCLHSGITAKGNVRGKVEVFYRASRFQFTGDPFLAEEKNLIDGLARQISLAVERREAEEERKKLHEQLLHADRLATIGELAAGFAHELNEPIGSILGFAQLAQKNPGVPPQISSDLEKIVHASLHAREVVKKLLLFSRQVPAKMTRTDLNRTVSEGLEFLSYRCAKENIRVEKQLDTRLPEITADGSQLHQVLVNLAVNSIQAMPGGGTLSVETRLAGDHVELVVEDTGIGMSEEVRERVFLPFFTTKKVGQGTGLGLAVVHGIVISHNGSVTVESKAGAGSRFVVRLPREIESDTTANSVPGNGRDPFPDTGDQEGDRA